MAYDFGRFNPKPIAPKPATNYNTKSPKPPIGQGNYPWEQLIIDDRWHRLGGETGGQTGGTSGWWRPNVNFNFTGSGGNSWHLLPGSDWQPTFDPAMAEFLGQYRASVENLLQNPTGMTPEEYQALRAQGLEAIGTQAQKAYEAALENAARMGLVGSPVSGQLPQAVAYQQAKAMADYQRQMDIQREQIKRQAVYQAQQAASNYAQIAENWENIKNKYGEDAAKLALQRALEEWNIKMKQAEAALQAQIAEEKINAARRAELYNLMNWLGSFGARNQNMSYQNALLEHKDYWNELEDYYRQQQQNSAGWSNLGALVGAALQFII